MILCFVGVIFVLPKDIPYSGFIRYINLLQEKVVCMLDPNIPSPKYVLEFSNKNIIPYHPYLLILQKYLHIFQIQTEGIGVILNLTANKSLTLRKLTPV
jgi:hypothetical protein